VYRASIVREAKFGNKTLNSWKTVPIIMVNGESLQPKFAKSRLAFLVERSVKVNLFFLGLGKNPHLKCFRILA